MTGVLDFGIGNIASILNMIECVHGKGMAVHTAEELALCKRLILPGVGAFDAGMSLLNLSGMYVYWGPLKGKLIHVPSENELKALGIYQ